MLPEEILFSRIWAAVPASYAYGLHYWYFILFLFTAFYLLSLLHFPLLHFQRLHCGNQQPDLPLSVEHEPSSADVHSQSAGTLPAATMTLVDPHAAFPQALKFKNVLVLNLLTFCRSVFMYDWALEHFIVCIVPYCTVL